MGSHALTVGLVSVVAAGIIATGPSTPTRAAAAAPLAESSPIGFASVNAGVLVEGNYFENVAHPSHVGYDKSGPGRLVARDNVFVDSGTPETAGTVTEPRTYYSYSLDNPTNVPSIVRAGSGVGRLGAAAVLSAPRDATAASIAPDAAAAVAATSTADGFAGVLMEGNYFENPAPGWGVGQI